MATLDYASDGVPDDYRCASCGAAGCKLWREYQTALIELCCCDCAGRTQGRDVSGIDAEGRIPTRDGDARTVQIGWRVPAVPTPHGDGYWGYAAVPDAAARWWRRLPTRSAPGPGAA